MSSKGFLTRTTVLLVVAAIVLAGCGPTAAQYESEADEYLSKLVEGGLFSGAVLVAREGEPLFSKCYGFADREREIAITPQTRFPLTFGATQFTAMANMFKQLVKISF